MCSAARSARRSSSRSAAQYHAGSGAYSRPVSSTARAEARAALASRLGHRRGSARADECSRASSTFWLGAIQHGMSSLSPEARDFAALSTGRARGAALEVDPLQSRDSRDPTHPAGSSFHFPLNLAVVDPDDIRIPLFSLLSQRDLHSRIPDAPTNNGWWPFIMGDPSRLAEPLTQDPISRVFICGLSWWMRWCSRSQLMRRAGWLCCGRLGARSCL
jgi:hypothetical protein